MNIFISVIIPIFNVDKYLQECLHSCLSQDYDNFEVILVNDGSSDKSLEIAKSFLHDKRVLLINKPNGGLSSARNMGTELILNTNLRNAINDMAVNIAPPPPHTQLQLDSKNNNFQENKSLNQTAKNNEVDEFKALVEKHFKILSANFIECDLVNINSVFLQELPQNQAIHYLDSDDYFEPECLKNCALAFKECENVDIVWHNMNILRENENKKYIYDGKKIFDSSFYEKGKMLCLKHWITELWFAWRGAFRASALNELRLRFTHSIEFEDNDFGAILNFSARAVIVKTFAGITYRVREGSITQNGAQDLNSSMPSYLEEIKHNFRNYHELKSYFRAYSYIQVALQMQKFATSKKRERIENIWWGRSIYQFIQLSKDAYNGKIDPKNMRRDETRLYCSKLGFLIIFYIIRSKLAKIEFLRNLKIKAQQIAYKILKN